MEALDRPDPGAPFILIESTATEYHEIVSSTFDFSHFV